jgi:hypothetical protein
MTTIAAAAQRLHIGVPADWRASLARFAACGAIGRTRASCGAGAETGELAWVAMRAIAAGG